MSTATTTGVSIEEAKPVNIENAVADLLKKKAYHQAEIESIDKQFLAIRGALPNIRKPRTVNNAKATGRSVTK